RSVFMPLGWRLLLSAAPPTSCRTQDIRGCRGRFGERRPRERTRVEHCQLADSRTRGNFDERARATGAECVPEFPAGRPEPRVVPRRAHVVARKSRRAAVERSVNADLDRIEGTVVDRGCPAAQIKLAGIRHAALVDPAPRALAKGVEPAEVAASRSRHDVDILLVGKGAPQPKVRMTGSARGSNRGANECFADERRPVRAVVELGVLAARDEMDAVRGHANARGKQALAVDAEADDPILRTPR